jgi:molybdopterin-guanine dinucleotide biosynthesis protein A
VIDYPASGRAGFVLVGGSSSRMGCDKALLPFRGGTLAGHVAAVVQAAAGSVALVGEPSLYDHLGYPVVRDLLRGAGPLAGICSALRSSMAAWNLVVACDMPCLRADFLEKLFAEAERTGADAVIPAGPSGRPEPLCAVYHARCLPVLAAAVARGVRKVMDGLAQTDVRILPVPEQDPFANCNTAQEWEAHRDKTPQTGV